MSKVQQGIAEAAASLLGGVFLTMLILSLAGGDLIPGYFIWLFGGLSILFNVATIESYRRVSLLYTAGWLLGSILSLGALNPLGIIINIACPAVIILLKCVYWIKNSVEGY
jgi:hypothetical protein